MIKQLMLFCISSPLIWAPSLGAQTGILVSETLDTPLLKCKKVSYPASESEKSCISSSSEVSESLNEPLARFF